MKGLRKLNLGLVLTILVVIGVVVYCINVEHSRKLAKNDINKACNEFIELTNDSVTLPSDMQVIGIKKADVNLEKTLSKTEEKLKEKMISEDAAKIQKLNIKQILEEQLLDTTKVTTNFERKIGKITSYEFDGNQVTVTFNSNITVTKKYKDQDSEKISEDSFEVTGETITLEKKDGNWKVVYANLTYRNPSSVITF